MLTSSETIIQCSIAWPFLAGAALGGLAAFFIVRVMNARVSNVLAKLTAVERKADLTEQKLKRVVESVEDGVVMMDERGKVVTVNAAAERLLGMNRLEVVGNDWTEALGWICLEKEAKAIASQPGNHQFAVKRRDGTSARLNMSLTHAYEMNNARAGSVCVLRRDSGSNGGKDSGESIQEEERHYREFFDNASIGMGITGPDFKFKRVNDALCRMFGYSREELIGVKPLGLTHPDDAAPNQELQEMISTGQIGAYRMEKRYLRKDGSVFWGIMNAAPVKDERGAALYYIGQIQDITQLKRTETALRESEERYRLLVENSPMPIMVHSDYVIRYINPAAVAALGGSAPKDFLGGSPLSLVYAEHIARADERIRRIYENRESTSVAAMKMVRLDGKVIDVEIMGNPVDYMGRPAAQTLFRDITSRKEAERALMEVTKEWAYAMDFFEDAVYLLDMDLRVKKANSAFYMMTGLTPAEVAGRNIQEILHHDADVDCPVCRAQDEKRDAIITLEADHPANPAGRAIEVMVKMVRDETRKPAAILMTIHDLTRQRAYEAALEESEEKYRTLISRMREGVVVIVDGKIQYANEAMEALLGYSQQEGIGSDFSKFLSPSAREESVRGYADRMAGKPVEDSFETRLLCKDGREVDVAASSGLINYDGKPGVMIVVRDITEKRRVQAALMESESKYRTLISQINEGIIVVQDGLVRLINEAMAENLGYSVEDMIGVSFHRFLSEESRAAVRTYNQDRLAGREAPEKYETQLLKKDGSVIDAAVSAGVISYDGRPAVLAAIRDITEMKQSHARLRESEERFRMFFENSPDAMLLAELDTGTLVDANLAAEKLFNRGREGFIGMHHSLLFPEDGKTGAREAFQRHTNGDDLSIPIENTIIRSDGVLAPVEVTAQRFLIDGKRVALGVFRDMTERKKTEAQLRTQAVIMANVPEGVVMVRMADGVIAQSNPKYDAMFGFEPGEMAGMKVSDWNLPVAGKAQEDVTREIREALIQKGEWSGEILNRKKNGEPFWTHNIITLYSDSQYGDVMLAVKRDITETKLVQEALRESEERYRALVENSDDCVCLMDLEGKFIFMNQKGLEMNGFAGMEEARGVCCLDLLGEEFRPVMEGALRRGKRGEPCHVRYMSRPEGKAEIWWDSVISPIRGAGGKVAALLRASRDITEQRRADEEIQSNQEMLEAISRAQTRFILGESAGRMFEGLLNRIASLSRSEFGLIGELARDKEGKPYLKAHAVSNMSGDRRAKRFLRKRFKPGMEFRKLDSLYGRVLDSGEYLISNDPGSDPRSGGVPAEHPKLTAFLGVPLKRGEELVGMIGLANRPGGYDEQVASRLSPLIVTCSQLVEANRADKRRKEAERAVRESEALLERLFSTTQMLLALLDKDMKFIKVNRAYAMADGKEVEFFPGKSHFALYPNAENEEIFREVARTGEPFLQYAKPFVYATNPERGVTYWDVSVQPIKEDGKVAYLLVSLFDVTSRKRIEEQARVQQQQLIQADKMKSLGILVAGVAHEINNPNSFIAVNAPLLKRIWDQGSPLMLRSLGGQESVMLGGMPLTKALEAAPKLLDGIAEGSKRIQIIVEKLKNFARVEPSAKKRPVDMNKAVESAALLTSSLIKRHTADFVTELSPGLPHILGNQMELEQVLINLISNALQALDDPKKGVKVRTEYAEENGAVRVLVMDQGCGIPKEDLGKITDPFFTTKRDKGGTGLGLSVSFGIVREHKGVMRFDSRQGEGTTVMLEFPAIGGGGE